jgi:hypothetical protein
MGRACDTNGGEGRCMYALVWEPEGKSHLEDVDVDLEDNIRKDFEEFHWEVTDWRDRF